MHDAELLESLGRPETLARVFAVDPSDVPVDEVMTTVRLACGGDARRPRARRSAPRAPALNLLGGFHHAAPGAAGGFCPVNDVAVAVAALRAEGFTGRVAVLDLDAHPPDGIAACLAQRPAPLDRLALRIGLGAARRGWTRPCCPRARATRPTSRRSARCSRACRARSSPS